ncbi:heme lyase CcmF/NrfE family subunit [Solimonas marina]|uniref:Heme lyase CcmF/NrfE family subunit n=1 Tax=Solimonas marina TaxID=2714601 RepID=A0A970B7X2_9GAMM|nr:heme lyase CcmF/NrfE family subunit [Solimonas marina]NKF21669.1 heme lyase CcmF/NrfE family subunit [Solimonas marina]
MTAELGQFALIAALIVAVLQTLVPAVGVRRRDTRLMAMASSGAQTQFLLILFAYGCLTYAFINKDWSIAYVAANSEAHLPLMYRATAVWGAHEGSMLLWMLMLSGWSAAVSIFNRRLPPDLVATALAVLGALSIGFLLFILITSNPFTLDFPVPDNGRDLNPLLQDPGFVTHPPMLYMGYVGFSVAFAFAIASLISGRLDAAWARWTRPWTTAAWLFLTIGITLGSWWSYHELGWGGWWFWDPVENASFMPWLIGTALIHSLAVTEKRGQLKAWTVLLAILAFALSLLGTFLVRSGVLVSVHAFATDPARGVFILSFLAIVLGIAFTLYAWRAPKFVSVADFALFSREGLLLLNNVFLVTAAAAVLIGTLYPLVIESINAGKVSVGPPFFNAVFVPLTIPLALLVGCACAVGWKRAKLGEVVRRLRVPAAIAVIVAIALPLLLGHPLRISAIGGGLLAVWIIVSAAQEIVRRVRAKRDRVAGITQIPRAIWGMTLAHVGLGIWVLGVTFTSIYSIEKDARLGPGETATLGGYTFALKGVTPRTGPNYRADHGEVDVERNGRIVAHLAPEKRLYEASGQVMTESAVDHNPLRDLYVALGEPIDKNNAAGDWAVRLYYKPLMRLVWIGGFLMAFGGLIAISDRRYRLSRAAATLPAGVEAA